MTPLLIALGGLLAVVLIAVIGALWMSGLMADRERKRHAPRSDAPRPAPAPYEYPLNEIGCTQCGRRHTRPSFFCSPRCARDFLLSRGEPPAGSSMPSPGAQPPAAPNSPAGISLERAHAIFPKRAIPRVPVPAPAIKPKPIQS